jgi:hypothetical protein
MSLKRFGALSIALLLVVAAMPAFAADATVGSFVIKLAKARNLAATDARIATDSLRGVGMRLPASLDHSKQLTEGEVARIARMMGINVSTSTPDDSFSSEQVDRFFVSFGSDLGGSTVTTNGGDGDDDGPAFNPYSKGKGGSKGKKKGHDFTPTEPE